jgi:putative transferase (TIGR04331 family)
VALLVTTALEWTWGENEPLVFLGEGCRRYERSVLWGTRQHAVVRNHWDDRSKFHRDQVYLTALHDELLDALARALGRLQGLERSRRYWQTLIDPWLIRYLGVAFDRWENLRVAFAEHDCTESIVRLEPPGTPLRDHFQFLEAIVSDEWNHDFYEHILRFEYAHRCTLRPPAVPPKVWTDQDTRPTDTPPGWRRVVRRIDRLCGWLLRTNRFAFVQTYFPLGALVRLNLSLGQLPIPQLGEFVWPDRELPHLAQRDAALRSQITLDRAPTRRFESFLHERIALDLPQVLVESFAWMRARAAAIRSRPKVIFSANAHWFNDLFKHWLAERVSEGAVFAAMEHGGAIPPRYSAMCFEEDIADVKTTWALPYHSKHVRLPPNRFVGRRSSQSRGTRLVVIGSEAYRYAHDACPTPLAGQTLVAFEHVCRLHDALEEHVQRAFLVKPYPDLGWRLRERFAARLGAVKVCSEGRLDRVLKTARIALCTYPYTTFSQAMICGAPALLVYPQHLWDTVPQFDALLAHLQDAQLVFADPEATAAHINRIWSEPQVWWNSPRVREARRRFEVEALDMRRDWLSPWVGFARELAAVGTPIRAAKLPTTPLSGKSQHI